MFQVNNLHVETFLERGRINSEQECSINANEIQIKRKKGDTFNNANYLYFKKSVEIVADGSEAGFATPFYVNESSSNPILIRRNTFTSEV